MNKRGQGATEYLIILAVVVIIALIVVGVLGGIPGIGKASSKQASEAYWGTTDVGITNYYVSAATDVLTLTMKDNLDTSIRIQNISVGGTINGSSTFTLTPGSTQTTSVAKACTTSGDAFDFTPVIIQYSDLSTGANYTFTGTVPLSGVCAA